MTKELGHRPVCIYSYVHLNTPPETIKDYYLTIVNMSQRWRKLATAGVFGNEDHVDGEIDLHKLNEVEPELFIKFVRIPSLKTYASLIAKLECCSKKWLKEFLLLGGLSSLFEVLEKLSERGLSKFSDAFLQLECVRCIKAVMNNVTGLEFITNHPSLTNQLVTGKLDYFFPRFLLKLAADFCVVNEECSVVTLLDRR